jgi:hypothetical protein
MRTTEVLGDKDVPHQASSSKTVGLADPVLEGDGAQPARDRADPRNESNYSDVPTPKLTKEFLDTTKRLAARGLRPNHATCL